MYPNNFEVPPDAFVWWVRALVWMFEHAWQIAAAILLVATALLVGRRLTG